ncbi:tryptophan--tRNA ligase [SAR86 cluster bacterium]|nr:tryptophan--tRNA ligase [SAR86 cluster bacterium]
MSSILTGITTSGTPHLGNYVGAIRPALEQIKKSKKSFLFLADYHSLIKQQDPLLTHKSSLEIASAWLACGLDPKETCFYRQSKVPQIMELNWILSNATSKGLLNRAHAYKAAQVLNSEKKVKDLDKGITAGLFNYPILMAADILVFDTDIVPVGSDQKQHIEMTRDIAARFNHLYEDTLKIPEAYISENIPLLLGTDGRKMSKSYKNYIELFSEEKALKKSLNQIVTDSLMPGEPKETKNSVLYNYFQAFATETYLDEVNEMFSNGKGWGELKSDLFDLINTELKDSREKYFYFLNNANEVEAILKKGEIQASLIAEKKLTDVRNKIGIKPLDEK